MAEEHSEIHRKQCRFSARNAVTQIGLQCGERCAIASAKGLITGALDELVTMIGRKAAYEAAVKLIDALAVPTEEQTKAWEPKKE